MCLLFHFRTWEVNWVKPRIYRHTKVISLSLCLNIMPWRHSEKWVIRWVYKNLLLMFIISHNASRLRIPGRQWDRLICTWAVLIWLRKFLEFKSGRGEWGHCSCTPFLVFWCIFFIVDCVLSPFQIVCRKNLRTPGMLKCRHPPDTATGYVCGSQKKKRQRVAGWKPLD